MDSTKDLLIKKAYATPSLRQNIFNKGTIFLYCDYAGYVVQNEFGVACCIVYNRTISVTAKKLLIEHDKGSNYGELLAIAYSLELLTKALTKHQPKVAIIFTDCSSILRILSKQHFPHHFYENVRNEILASLDHLNNMFPEVKVSVKYISKHKKNNHLHRMAHNEARHVATK
ncbi:hypothetical protein [Paenibacillus macquariensis]|uniref:RNase H type-1 domain-containing protein n=1 Tax=Paenibacillus macquariensis TaxID=948756 RepID=A0ABY1JK55_9BACL|nr:hypothetical protein [Paenibacillus macquariensis]MEC0089863.1 hypothetical protein [Paenibacillus macquariensis]OAB30674.1 hypothetical protein PMSM_21245 [Paenibacillus macquariensis subsp. macquariensis]SIQ32893.1 hypothetical protein SAMN05421578_101243 [Paenibacillus macquariensis]